MEILGALNQEIVPLGKENEVPVLGNGAGDNAEEFDVIFWTGCFGYMTQRSRNCIYYF